MARSLFRLPPGYVAERCTAGGRNGATRWSLYHGTAIPAGWRDQDAAYAGDIVRFQPENEWVWQPAGCLTAPETVLTAPDAPALLTKMGPTP
jgi:hypothetical protein